MRQERAKGNETGMHQATRGGGQETSGGPRRACRARLTSPPQRMRAQLAAEASKPISTYAARERVEGGESWRGREEVPEGQAHAGI
jgi:hypothetical protein